MFATAKGYYNGSQIVLDTPAQLEKGQEVVIAYVIPQSEKIKEPEEKQESIESIVDSLVGAVPNSGKNLEEYREERLKKYENFN